MNKTHLILVMELRMSENSMEKWNGKIVLLCHCELVGLGILFWLSTVILVAF